MKCCELNAGKLRHLVAIQKIAKTSDGAGGWTSTWTDHLMIRAFLNPLSGNERLQADRLESTVVARCFTRYRPDIEAKQRLVFEGKAYQIRSVIDLESRKRWLQLDLEQGVAT